MKKTILCLIIIILCYGTVYSDSLNQLHKGADQEMNLSNKTKWTSRVSIHANRSTAIRLAVIEILLKEQNELLREQIELLRELLRKETK